MKKTYFITGIILLLAIAWLFVRFVIGGDEDSWIKDERGVWVKHGNPSETPEKILKQQEAITCALEKFNNFSDEFDSQCLGVCGNYAVDVVHVPRTQEDNIPENQCDAYRNGEVGSFIELDKYRNIVRIE